MDPVTPSLTVLCTGCNDTLSIPDDTVLQETLSRLRTGYIPTPSDLLEIDNSLPQLDHALERHEQEILRLRSTLDMLNSQYDKLKAHVVNLNGLKAPIRRLPTELATQVFQHKVDLWERHKGFVATALFLGQVCVRWRNIALSFKGLWSSIGVGLDDLPSATTEDSGETVDPRILGLMETYFDRSYPAPLSIYVISVHNEDDIRPDHPVLRLLASVSHRWREAELQVWPEDLTAENSALAAIEGNLPLLENLHISAEGWNDDSDDDDSDEDDSDEMRFFRTCPKLRELSIKHEFSTATLPLHQLTTLEGNQCSVENFMDLFEACHNLIFLEMCHLVYHGEDVYPQVSSNLRSMRMSSFGDTEHPGDRVALLFDAWTLPHLRDLTLRHGPNIWPQESFISLLYRSSCHLHTLDMDNMDISDTELIEILKVVPTLTTLKITEPLEQEIERPIVTTAFLTALAYSQSSSGNEHCLVPRLSHIELFVIWPFDEAILLDMLESRCLPASINLPGSSGIACMESLRFTSVEHKFGVQAMARLELLRATGLRIVLQSFVSRENIMIAYS